MMIIATSAGAAIVAPVAANEALSDSASGRMCMGGNPSYVWMIGNRGAGSSTLINLTSDNNNKMHSWANKSGIHEGCMFGGTNGTGNRQEMAFNSSEGLVNAFNGDEVSSWRTRYGC